MKFNVGQLLTNRANLFGKKEAFVRDQVRLSFSQLNERANAIAHYLLDKGYVAGDRLGIICKNNEYFAATFFGAAKIGVITVAINYKLQPREIAFILNHCQAKGVMYGDELKQLVNATKPIVLVEHFFSNEASNEDELLSQITEVNSHTEPVYQTDGDDPILMIYTSGTTGKPKGVMLSHTNLIASAVTLSTTITWFETDRFLHFVPLFHIAGFVPLITNVHAGTTTIFMEEFEPIAAWKLIEQEKITTMMSVPEMLASLIKCLDLVKPNFSSIRTITCGAAAVSQQIIIVFKQFGIPVQQVYGLTEFAGSLTMWRSEFDELKYGSKGKPVMYSELKVVSLETGETLGANEDGEVLCRGPQLFLGYYKNEESTAAAIQDGWYRTGDIGHIDEDGFLYLVDRIADVIVTNGEKVYSAEVEAVLITHPAVAEVAVIGAPRPDFGEIPVAYIVVKPGQTVTKQELIRYCKRELAAYKVVREVNFVDCLPRNIVGKLLKEELRSMTQNKGIHN